MTHAPPPDSPPPPVEYGHGRTARPVPSPFGGHAAVALVIGLLFLYLALPMFQWLGERTGNPYGVVTVNPDGSDGPPVAYADLPAGTIWRDIGTAATAVVLLIEAMLYAGLMRRPDAAPRLLPAVVVVTTLGAVANGVAVAMQMRAGFDAPLYAFVGAVVCGWSAVSAWRQHRGVA